MKKKYKDFIVKHRVCISLFLIWLFIHFALLIIGEDSDGFWPFDGWYIGDYGFIEFYIYVGLPILFFTIQSLLKKDFTYTSSTVRFEIDKDNISSSNNPIKKELLKEFETDKGVIMIELFFKGAHPAFNNRVYQNNIPAKDGQYKLDFMDYIVVKNGIIVDLKSFG